ncbi:MAG: hypothetical protein QXV12_00790 [Candidatus Rehaiarchaeum fermentans]|nr:hypothetical protein [Candidatus Rehaiarchaeum fermentans]MCW1293524.1 hypothetical protein [Candidatus Rehaiarchaeum fermentans]
MRASEEYLSWMIALILLAPVAIIIFLIYFFGIAPITNSLSQVQSYVNFLMLSQKTGEVIISPGISPSLPYNKFMIQIYVNSSCLTYLDYLSRVGIMSYPSDPNSLLNNFAVCIGSFSNNIWPYSPNNLSLITNSIPVWMGYLIINSSSAYFPNYSFNLSVHAIKGSKGALSFFNSESLSQVSQTLAFNCLSFLRNKIYRSNSSNYAFQYITSLQCASLSKSFISIENNCVNSSCYQPFAFMHGSPAEFQYQECHFNAGIYNCYTYLI